MWAVRSRDRVVNTGAGGGAIAWLRKRKMLADSSERARASFWLQGSKGSQPSSPPTKSLFGGYLGLSARLRQTLVQHRGAYKSVDGGVVSYATREGTHFAPEDRPTVVLTLVKAYFSLGDPQSHAGLVSPCQVLGPTFQQIPILRGKQFSTPGSKGVRTGRTTGDVGNSSVFSLGWLQLDNKTTHM